MSLTERTLIFLHHPRTAGTTLSTTIERLFPPSAVFPGTLGVRLTRRTIRVLWGKRRTTGQILEEFSSLSEREKGEIRYLHGHLPFGIHTGLPRPGVYVTMLRDPVGRMISLYHFLKRRPDFGFYDQVKGMSLRDFVGEIGPYAGNNAQVRRISGARLSASLTPDTLEIAKSNLCEHFVVVGITERASGIRKSRENCSEIGFHQEAK